MWAWLRSRGVSFATRYHEELKSGPLIPAATLREPLPERQAQPVDHLVRPDPHQAAAVDLDLAHAFHPRTQPFGRVVGVPLDPEVVSPFARRRHGRDLVEGERYRVVRGGGEQELAALPDRDVRHLTFVDLQHDAIAVERRHFEEHLPALYGCAERLAEITLHDHPVELREHAHA